jgi:hypothetical protein
MPPPTAFAVSSRPAVVRKLCLNPNPQSPTPAPIPNP